MTHANSGPEFGSAERTSAAQLIDWALAEDLADRGDITSQYLLPENQAGHVRIVARAPGVFAGVPVGQMALEKVDPSCRWQSHAGDGQSVVPGMTVASLSGPVQSLLTAERTILNFLTHLSGIATLTRLYVDAVEGTRAAILDTRKTLPGWRALQKYAVRCGGGTNHRMGLWDAVLIKDNHLAAFTSQGTQILADAVRQTRQKAERGVTIEIEVDSLDQLTDALSGPPDIVLLDNMSPSLLRDAVELRDRLAPEVLLEASGGVDLATVREIARSGVDRISVGRLTHSAAALDLAFDWGQQ